MLLVLATHMPALSPGWLSIRAHAPDLWTLVVLYVALRGRGRAGVGLAILVGAARDAVSLDPLGTNAFVLGALAFFFTEGARDRGRVEGGVRLMLVFLGVVAAHVIYALRVLPLGGGFPGSLLLAAFPTALWSTLFAAALFPLLDRYALLDDLTRRSRALPA